MSKFLKMRVLSLVSLEHPHSQLIATPLVPPFIEELKGAKSITQNRDIVFIVI